jgi:hypothetical protein
MRHVLAQPVLIPDSFEEQQLLADEMAQRMNLIIKTKQAYQEQLELLDIYTQKALTEFPHCSENLIAD